MQSAILLLLLAGDLEDAHWAYQPINDPAWPPVVNEAWCRTPIDRFVLARLEAAGLSPALEADRPTLLRRLSLDLCGLPPTPEEVRTFLDDDRPDAYERLVERLLASPAHAERWARYWRKQAPNLCYRRPYAAPPLPAPPDRLPLRPRTGGRLGPDRRAGW